MPNRLCQFGHFMLHYSVFISLCAAAMTYETGMLSGVFAPNWPLLLFQFSATLFAYNFYYIRSRFHPWSPALCMASVPPAAIAFWFMTPPSYLVLSVVCLCALLYTLPGLLGFRYTPPIKLIRLFLLSLTWTLATFVLPLKDIDTVAKLAPYALYRFLFIWNLSLLFFMRDEMESFKAQHIRLLLGAGLLLQGMLAIGIAGSLNSREGVAYLATWILQTGISIQLTLRRHPDKDYLLYVDGIMPAQTIFVMLMHFWHPF